MFAQPDAPIFHFMAERDSLIHEVVDRVVRAHLQQAARAADKSLEYVLNEAAFLEMQRLERGASALDLHPYDYWQQLARSLRHLDDAAKVRTLRELAAAYADDVAGRFTPTVYRFATKVLPVGLSALFNAQRPDTWLQHAKKLSERVILSGAVAHWRRLTELGTVIVVPTHSSNLDSIAVGWALHEAGLPPVTYGAGKNLFTHPLTSFFMHNLGAYKVDRRIRHTLYKEVLKTYSEVLLERGYHSLFFPGGTRSRSNHVESKLKLGLLGTGLTAMTHNLQRGKRKPDVFVCPLTINYHLVLEAETLIDDFLRQDGGSRYLIEDDEFASTAEVARFLLKTMSMEYTIYLRFGEPMDLFGNPVDTDGRSRDPRGRVVDPGKYLMRASSGGGSEVVADPVRDAEYTRQCGLAIADAFQRNTVAVSTAVVAWAVWRLLAERYPGLDLYQRLRVSRNERLPLADVGAAVDRALQAVRALAARGRLCLGHEVERLDAQGLLEAAARVFGMYHPAPVLALRDGGVEVGHPRLLYFYANRLDGLDLDRAV